jgi:hypothetical protein
LSYLFCDITITLRSSNSNSSAAAAATTTLAGALAAEFPRALTLRALVSLSTTLGEREVLHDERKRCWEVFRALERACMVAGVCARRGCDGGRTGQCGACKKVEYCGPECLDR